MAGAGFAPAGESIAGYGTVATTTGPPATILIDPLDGQSKDTRAIDPYTRQYVYDAQGRPTGQRGVPHLVQMALMTMRNSSALGAFGKPSPPALITNGLVAELTRDYQIAVKDLVDNGLVEVLGITIDRASPIGERVRFKWRDLTTKKEQTELA